MYGFQREIIAATAPADGCLLAYIESEARQYRGGGVEVSFHLLIREPDGAVSGCELPGYNPYFGCEVGYLEWHGDAAILVYREKHSTYACRFALDRRPTFIPITHDWQVTESAIEYRVDGEPSVRRLLLPDLSG